MSKTTNNKLELINSTIIPKSNNYLYEQDKNILIYSIFSNIVTYNLSNDSKRIIQNKIKSEISNIKFLDKDKNILLLIHKGKFPIINILPLSENNNDNCVSNIYSKIITIEENFNISNIFVDRFRYNLFLILLSGINKNILYFFHLTNMNNNKYSLIPIGILQKLNIEVIDFKSFYNLDLIICITRNSLLYYKINLENQICSLYKKIQFHFSIKSKSLKIDRKKGFISFITSSGNCLIYDKEGNNINNIKFPLNNNNEYFTFNIFSEFNNSLCLVTNQGNILIYDIYEVVSQNYDEKYDFKIKQFIKNSNINQILKEKYQFNKNDINYINNDYYLKENKNNNIEIIYYNESNNLIMTYNNSLLSLSLFDIINKNFNVSSILLYQFNHSQKINNGIIIYNASPTHLNQNNENNNNLDFDNIIYTCSDNNILNTRYYNYSKNKFISYNYNFNYILSNKEIYITSIKFHPKYPKDILYLGDSQGFLYIISKERNFNYHKYNLNDINNNSNNFDNAINLIMFSPRSEYIIYIGFDNGLQKLFDLKVDKNFNYYKLLSNPFLDKNEIIFRKNKSHIINFCYFFIYKNNLKDCFAYLVNQKTVKISKFETENNLCISNSYNNDIFNIIYNEPILDIKIHKSENYIISLNNKKQIYIKEINNGNIISILDFNKIINYIYNFDLDISGLYLSLICDFKNNQNNLFNINSNKSSISIVEITSGKISNYIRESNNIITKTKFDYYGRYIISLGEKGEISIWKLNSEVTNNIQNAIEKIKNNFYDFWERFNIKRGKENLYLNNEENIMDEILIEDLIDKEKFDVNEENNFNINTNREDFFRINNHGEKSIYKNSLLNDDNSVNNNNSFNKLNKIQPVINDDDNNINDIINTDNLNNNNNDFTNINDNDYSLEEDHYINRNIYNYKNSVNYIQNNLYNGNNKIIPELKKSNSIKTKTKTESNKNILMENKKENILTQKPKSFRDMILNNKSRNKENQTDFNNKNYKNIKNIETPQFNIITDNHLDKIDLRLFSFNSEDNEDNKDILELKKKIIKQSSNLEYNQRRVINLNNAMNKIKTKNNILLNEFEENKVENNDNFYANKIRKKYSEPSDIDQNLVNLDTKNKFKINKNIIKSYKNNDKDASEENLFYINNRPGSKSINNNNMNITNNTNSYSYNNSFLEKNYSKINLNMNMNNIFNENDLSNNNQNISVGDQISYLENNIKKFEKTFGN